MAVKSVWIGHQIWVPAKVALHMNMDVGVRFKKKSPSADLGPARASGTWGLGLEVLVSIDSPRLCIYRCIWCYSADNTRCRYQIPAVDQVMQTSS
jgi:hypothetical protein